MSHPIISLPVIPHNSRSSQSFTSIPDESITPGWYISPECMQRFEGLKIEKRLGKGGFGTVHDLCSASHCDKIVKVVPLSANNNTLSIMGLYISGYIDIKAYYRQMEQIWYRPDERYAAIKAKFEKEVTISKIASQLGVGPIFIDAFICSNNLFYPVGQIDYLGFIITEKWDLTLHDYLKTHQSIPSPLADKLVYLLEQLHSAGIYHDDLSFSNIMLRMNKANPIDVTIIDYGLSDFINSPPTEQFAIDEMTRLVEKLKPLH